MPAPPADAGSTWTAAASVADPLPAVPADGLLLGISCYFHSAAAAIVRGGEVVAAAEEERFTRRKHDASFPRHAIRYCLAAAKAEVSDLELVCFYEQPWRKLERTLATGHVEGERSLPLLRRQLARLLGEELFLDRVLERELGYDGPVHLGDHHLSHAASAFYPSRFEEAAVLTADGVGEWTSLATFGASRSGLKPLRSIRYPHSLGLLYTALTAFLGFRANSDEYKVMGLAAYGRPRYEAQIGELLKLNADGSFALGMDYFTFTRDETTMVAPAVEQLFAMQARQPQAALRQQHKDLAASLQKAVEDALVAVARSLRQETGASRLCMAGGVALNGLANWRIAREAGFDEVFIQPAAGDAGGAVGAALEVAAGARRVAGRAGKSPAPYTTLLGPSFADDEIRQMLEAAGASYERLEDDELLRRAAERLEDDLIVGWFQGAMEFGPRALGNRSILANPCNPEMKDILNARVKFREDFRPFAPAVPLEEAGRYFELDFPSPYMLLIPQVRESERASIPSVVHLDGSARVQTVDRRVNPRFHALLHAFGELTGTPVLLNTSFNVQGEPIVCTPADAYRCFRGTEIDVLFLGNYEVLESV